MRCKEDNGMLQEFKVRNYKNFRDEITFSLKTEKNYEYNNALIKDARGVFKATGIPISVFTSEC